LVVFLARFFSMEEYFFWIFAKKLLGRFSRFPARLSILWAVQVMDAIKTVSSIKVTVFLKCRFFSDQDNNRYVAIIKKINVYT
jgi:hypothetical protein